MHRKLLLINPVQNPMLSLGTVTPIRVPPISLSYLAALTPPDWEIRIVDENVEPLILEDADFVGITAYTSNSPRAYEVSEHYRQRGIKTVIGGVHASMLPDEAMRFADSVVVGEAESIWSQVLNDFDSNDLKRCYRGEHIFLENLVKQRRDLLNYDKYYVKGHVETARGCPNDCEFCSVTALYGRKYRQRPVEDVLDELETIESKNLFFLDDNILGYGRQAEERATQLFRGMVERGLNKRWACQVGIDFADNPNLLRLAKNAGCLAAFIGFESLNEESLQSMHKARNLRMGVSNYAEVVKRIRDHGILVSGAFVFGSDGDKKDVFDRTAEFVLKSKMDGAQFSILTPLPGTRLYARLKHEGRLLRTNYPDDWRYYGFTRAVFRPMHMMPDELEDGVTQVYRYTDSILASLKRSFQATIRARSLYAGAFVYLYNRGFHSFWLSNYEYARSSLISVFGDSSLPTHIIAGIERDDLVRKSGRQTAEPQIAKR